MIDVGLLSTLGKKETTNKHMAFFGWSPLCVRAEEAEVAENTELEIAE